MMITPQYGTMHFFTFSHYILFYSGLLRHEGETDLNVMYVSASQCVIIKPCGSQLSYDITAHTCDLLWYWQDMIISWIRMITIITQMHVMIHKCDHILWSYKDVNENTWLICHETYEQILRCLQLSAGDQNSSFLLAFSTCPQLLPSARQDFAKFAYLSKALYKYIYLKMSIKSNIFFDKS